MLSKLALESEVHDINGDMRIVIDSGKRVAAGNRLPCFNDSKFCNLDKCLWLSYEKKEEIYV